LTGTSLFTLSRLLCQWQTPGNREDTAGAVLVQDVDALARLSAGE